MPGEPPVCVRCNLPVVVNQSMYDVFERMHWVCFHFEFEHQGDPDAPCSDPGCPMRLQAAETLLREIRDRKHSLPRVLVQLERYFAVRPPPDNGAST
jgi:hypothetical protein